MAIRSGIDRGVSDSGISYSAAMEEHAMFRITQGAPAEHQVWIFAGLVMFFLMAPVVVGIAGLMGYLTRPAPTQDAKTAA